MANEATTSTLAADLVPVLIKEKLLSIAEKQTVFYELGDKETLPENSGKTVQFTRYERLPLPNAPLAEGVPPTNTPLTTSVVQAVVDQWGATVGLTDVADLTVRHPVLKVAQQRLGTQHNELVDREVQRTLMGGSNVSFSNNRASRSALVAGDYLTTDDIRRAVSTLRATGAMDFDGSNYVGVFDPYVEMDLTKDSTFVTASSYSNIKTLLNAEVGMWMGVRWKRSNYIPIVAATSTGIAIAANTTLNSFTGFTASSSVRAKATKLDATTGFETSIFAEATITNAAAFRVLFTFSADGIYNCYTSLQDGAAGTPTFQVRVTRSGTNVTVNVAKAAGTGTVVVTGNAQETVVTATGAIAPPDGSTAGNTHLTYVFGKEAFGVIDLAGLKTYITPATPTTADPLVQLRIVGWKQIFKAVIKSTDFFRRIESLSAFN